MSEPTDSGIPPVVTTEAKPFPTRLEMALMYFSNEQTSKSAIDAAALILTDRGVSGDMVGAFVEGIRDMRVAMFLAWEFFLEELDISAAKQVTHEVLDDPAGALQRMRDDILYANLVSYDQGEYPERNREPGITNLFLKLNTNNDNMYVLGTVWAMNMVIS